MLRPEVDKDNWDDNYEKIKNEGKLSITLFQPNVGDV